VMMTVHEPKRRASAALKMANPTWADAMRYLRDHAWVYLPFFAAIITGGWAGEGFRSWLPTALIRGWALAPSEIAHVTATLGLTCGLGGLFAGSWVMDTLTKRGYTDAPLRVLIVAHLSSLACNLTLLHMTNTSTIFGIMGVERLMGGASATAMALTLSSITPSRLMGRLTAFMFLSMNLLSSTGSTTVALIAKYFFVGPLAIIPAMQCLFAPVQLIAAGLLVLTALRVQRFHRLYEGGAG